MASSGGSQTPADRCRLLELPAELRLDIYDRVYPLSKFVFYANERRVSSQQRRAGDATATIGLLSTCRTIRSEALPIFWDSITFKCLAAREFPSQWKTTALLGFSAFKHMRTLILNTGSCAAPHEHAMEAVSKIITLINRSAPALQSLRLLVFSYPRYYTHGQDRFDGLMSILSRVRSQGKITIRLSRDKYTVSGLPLDLDSYYKILRNTGSIEVFDDAA